MNVLESGIGVCEGFSNLTIALLRSVGIPAILVSGDAGAGLAYGYHAWVEAYVDDRWIIIDPTWMEGNRTRYFDISLRELSRSHRYNEINIPYITNGLIVNVLDNSIIGVVGDTDIISEATISSNITFLRDALPVAIAVDNGSLRPFANIESLVLPEGFTNFSTIIFSRTGLSEVFFPDSLESIGSGAFVETNLKNIVLPPNLNVVGTNAFYETSLNSLILPDSLETIRNDAFNNAGLYSVYIPSSTSAIAPTTFNNNPHLTFFGHTGSTAEDFAYNNDIPFVAVQNFEVVDDFAMDGNTLLFPMFDRDKSEIALPEGITEIANNAFRNFENLTELNIPEGVTSICESAFANTGIEAVFLPPTVTYIGSNAFDSNVSIYGHLGTAAEGFANEHGNEFVK